MSQPVLIGTHGIYREGDTVICRYEGATSIEELAAVEEARRWIDSLRGAPAADRMRPADLST